MAAMPAAAAIRRGGSGKMVLDVMQRRRRSIVAGTDTPNAINLHGELMAYTMAA